MRDNVFRDVTASMIRLKVTRAMKDKGRDAALSDDEFIAKYASLVRNISSDIAERTRINVEVEDLMGWGYQGLLEARERYDPAGYASFSSYAYYRIRGSILDGIRRTGWSMRGMSIRLQDMLSVNQYLESEVLTTARRGGLQTFEESMDRLGHMVDDCVTICLLSTEQISRLSLTVAAKQAKAVQSRELREELARSIEELRENEREVLVGYYFKGESMAEIGERLGLSASWICRIHANAIRGLRAIMRRNDSWLDKHYGRK